MRKLVLLSLALLTALTLGLLGCEEEEEGIAEGEDGEIDVLEQLAETTTAAGQWVTYTGPEGGEITLAFLEDTADGYLLEFSASQDKDMLIAKALLDSSVYEEFEEGVHDFFSDPEGEQDGMMSSYMTDPSMETMDTEELRREAEENLDKLEANLKELQVQVDDKNAFDVKVDEIIELAREMLPDLLAMTEDFAAMAEEFEDEVEEEDAESEEATFETTRNEKVEIAGRTMLCNILTITADGDVAEIYYSPEIPFTGVVKIVHNGEDQLVMKDFGDEGAQSAFTVTELQPFGRRELEGILQGMLMMTQMAEGFGEAYGEYDFEGMGEGGEMDIAELERMAEEMEGMYPQGQ